MAHWAKINTENVVTEVVVVGDGQPLSENNLPEILSLLGGTWIQTSYNTRNGVHLLNGTPLRKNYAGPGYSYDESLDAFIPPKVNDSWILDLDTCTWKAPVAYPNDGKGYLWDEESTSWKQSDLARPLAITNTQPSI